MATLTSNGSFSSLSISGSGTKNGNITFNPPTLPDGATIISTSLTANLDISMRLGSANVTINGNTYSSSSSLSIDLGTSLISSLSVSAKGSSFLARGTVSITNIVYTVNYVVKHIINVSTSDGGTISESGDIEVEDGNSKTFTFTPNTGYKIDDVVVDGVSVGAVTSYTFNNVTSNHTISVSFAIMTYTISASVGNGGSISPSGSISVNYGSSRTFTISANSGYKIDNVIVDGVSVGSVGSHTFSNVTENHTISATFRQVFTISASCGENGSISESGEIEVEPNSSKSFTFSANKGYIIDTVLVDGINIGKVDSYIFENITSNHTISVSFTEMIVNVTVINNSNREGVMVYPLGEHNITGNESFYVKVTEYTNSYYDVFKNDVDIKNSRLQDSNSPYEFLLESITDGFGKGKMYLNGNMPSIYTDESDNKMLYMDGTTILKNDINRFSGYDLTISFDFMLTNLNDTDHRCLLELNNGTLLFKTIGYRLFVYIVNTLGESKYYYIGEETIENNVWYNFTYCRNGDIHYFFVNGVLITTQNELTNVEKIEFINIFGNTSHETKTIDGCCSGYIKNIVMCDSCLHISDFQPTYEFPNESDFSGEYVAYKCTDTSIFENEGSGYAYFSKFEVLGKIKIIDDIFYPNVQDDPNAKKSKTLYINKRGILIKPALDWSMGNRFLLSFWYQPVEDITNYNYPCLICISNTDTTSNISIYLRHNEQTMNTNVCIYKYENGIYDKKVTDFIIEKDQKYYFTLEYDRTTCYLYINGELIESHSFNNTTKIANISIGCKYLSNNECYDSCVPGNYGFISFGSPRVTGLMFNVYPIEYPIRYTCVWKIKAESIDDIIIEIKKQLPVLTLEEPSRYKISSIVGYDSSVVKFESNQLLTQWEARATIEGEPYGRGIGLLVEKYNGNGYSGTITIDDEELTNGDAKYRISVYGKNNYGEWSDG